jgi:hypothetical protein
MTTTLFASSKLPDGRVPWYDTDIPTYAALWYRGYYSTTAFVVQYLMRRLVFLNPVRVEYDYNIRVVRDRLGPQIGE